jgi:hypothetical protein
MPILLAVLMTRQAISPRLAIRILLNIAQNGPLGWMMTAPASAF